jgi:hypothetical protein
MQIESYMNNLCWNFLIEKYSFVFLILILTSSCDNKNIIEQYITSNNLPYNIIVQKGCSEKQEGTQFNYGCKTILQGDLTGDGTEDNVCVVKYSDIEIYNILIVHGDNNSKVEKAFVIGTYDALPAGIEHGELRLFDEEFFPDEMNWTIAKSSDIFNDGDAATIIVIQASFNAWEIRYNINSNLYELIQHSE